MRKLHNSVKRHLIQRVVVCGASVLDVGCGQGGDIQKWGCAIHACDPDKKSLMEAMRRGKGTGSQFFLGDIRSVPRIRTYDCICYNFSFQYCFLDRNTFLQTMDAIVALSTKGTQFFGIVPDSEMMMEKYPAWVDSMGNSLRFVDEPKGDFGELVDVEVVDAPYYKNGPKSEPIAYKDILITECEKRGFELVHWAPIVPCITGMLTDIYSEFIFTRIE